ncbi:MAG TPA: hypothetical protein VFF04_03720 [Candidatus Babeliales bacterium]|nr:hypothetical protein [Candidatus Babeliales bacterium]
MKLRLLLINIIAITLFYYSSTIAKTALAFVAVPIADLVGQPLQTPKTRAKKAYQAIPLCGGNINPFVSCQRMHQLIFNEVVEILDTKNDEVLIKVPHVFYVTTADKQSKQQCFWTLKENLFTFNELEKLGLKTDAIPRAITEQSNQPIITLIEPLYDQKTDLMFSVGTRFVYDPSQSNSKQYCALAFDKKHFKFLTLVIPRKMCIIPAKTQKERIKQCIELIRSWIHYDSGYIPYVWGGCSFTTTCTQPKFIERKTWVGSTETSYFEIPGYDYYPKPGFDCSNLILRAAQCVGLPYYYKNTVTIEEFVPALKKDEPIDLGDLILVRGHVMMVSDTKHNMLIEARSYPHGYGKVQEVPLAEVFEGISTYPQLRQAYLEKRPVQRKDINGNVRETFPYLKICRIG